MRMSLLSGRDHEAAQAVPSAAPPLNDLTLTSESRQYLESAWSRLQDYFGGDMPAFADPRRYIYVNPLEVQFRCGLSYPPEAQPIKGRLLNYGRVTRDHRWERKARPIFTYSLVQCLQRRFIDGTSWETSGAIDLKLREIQRAGRPIDGARNKSDLIKRYERIDRLFDDMMKNGFKRQVDLDAPAKLSNEMFVSIGRSGRLYFSNGGNHRLFISQILRLPAIPFLVMARDEEWIKRVQRAETRPSSPIRHHPDYMPKEGRP